MLVSQHISIDWSPVMQFNGITYVSTDVTARQSLQTEQLGTVFATVQFQLADNVHDPHYRLKEGDAAFLPIGTPIYILKEYDPRFRLAALQNARIELFEADTNPTAQRGAELLDIVGKVDYIGINSETDGTTELGAIKDPKFISQLVEMIVNAQVDQSSQNRGDGNERYFLALHLNDKTVVNRPFWPASGRISRNIMLPEAFGQAVRQAVRNAPSFGS